MIFQTDMVGTTELCSSRLYKNVIYALLFNDLQTHSFIKNGMKNFSGAAGQQRVEETLYLII